MYSGTTITNHSGNLIGVHQKIDKLARRNLGIMLPNNNFPTIKNILHFEGSNGPDAIKRKSPSKNEPWHFLSPYDLSDDKLLITIEYHFNNLIKALKDKNLERSSFEAAWLSHAMVDGLTPAHHYPYEEKLSELRNGEGIETRTNIKKRLIMSGEKKSEIIQNNWKMWGPKGLFITHLGFEIGVASIMAPLKFKQTIPSQQEIDHFNIGIDQWYRQIAQEVASLNLYDDFYKMGWTISLTKKIKKFLAPTLIKCITVVWYQAALQSTELKV